MRAIAWVMTACLGWAGATIAPAALAQGADKPAAAAAPSDPAAAAAAIRAQFDAATPPGRPRCTPTTCG